MTETDFGGDSELERDLQIEEICERYEAAWREGRFPAIAPGLGEIDQAAVAKLLHELVARELPWRKSWGQIPPWELYVRLLMGDGAPGPETPGASSSQNTTLVYDGELTPSPLSGGDQWFSIRCRQCRKLLEIPKRIPVWGVACANCGSSIGCSSPDSTVEGQASKRDGLPPPEISHFQLILPLGEGGFGSVWLARDHHLDKLVAIKIPHPGCMSPAELERFRRDARAAAQVRHPHVVAVHEVDQCRGLPYIVSDYIDGPSLEAWLKQHGKPSPRRTAELCKLIAEALHEVHQVGVIHRDLKPANILMDRKDEPHLVDFGLAKRETESGISIAGLILGTAAYMSPEQAEGKPHQADRRSDVYSLGTILFEMLTGSVPFHGDRDAVLKQVVNAEPHYPRQLNQNVPRDLETICLRCLEKEPHRRFATAKELADELDRYLTGQPILSRPIGRVGRVWRWSGRNRAVASLLATVAMVLVLGSVVSSFFAVREARARAEAEANFHDARNAVQDLLTTVSNSTLLNQPGMQSVQLFPVKRPV